MSAAGGVSPGRTFRIMKWLLGAQIALAGLLVAIDLAPTIPRLLSPSEAPSLDQPIRPGDQTRHYQPNRPAAPGPGVDPDMPRRLLVDRIEVDDTNAIRVRGAVAPGDGERVAQELNDIRPVLVTLDSPGGSVVDALMIGRMLREIGAETRLDDNAVCFSACPYMFVGGVIRRVSETARLGVHQHSFGESTILPAFLAVEDIQRGQAGVLSHLDDMDIDLRIMGPALKTPPDEVYILAPDELLAWNVVTSDPD